MSSSRSVFLQDPAAGRQPIPHAPCSHPGQGNSRRAGVPEEPDPCMTQDRQTGTEGTCLTKRCQALLPRLFGFNIGCNLHVKNSPMRRFPLKAARFRSAF